MRCAYGVRYFDSSLVDCFEKDARVRRAICSRTVQGYYLQNVCLVFQSRTHLIYERRGYIRTGHIESYPVFSGVGQPLVHDLQVEILEKLADRVR